MIIAPPTTPSPSSSAPVDPGHAATRGGPDASDGPATTAVGDGFGHLLAKRMDDGSADDLVLPDVGKAPATDATTLVRPDGKPFAVTNASPVIGIEAAVTIGLPTTPLATATKGSDAKPDEPERKEIGSDAGNDLAAQLALVSQWAALPSAAAKAGDATQGDGLDIKGKLETVRITSSKLDAAANAVPLAAEPAQATVVPAAEHAATVATPFDRSLRSASTTTAAVTRASDVKAKGDAQAAVAGERASLAEAILGKVDAPVIQPTSDATTLANAFVSQVTAQASNAQTAAAAAATPAPSQLQTTVGTAAWSHEVGQATLRMAANDLQNASLRLNPEHLGPLDVQVRIDNGVAHLAFGAAHAETRQALESSRATLDQLFADQGLKIGDCAVGDSSAQRRFDAESTQGGSQRDGSRWGSANAAAADPTTSTVTTTVRRALGLVDTFA